MPCSQKKVCLSGKRGTTDLLLILRKTSNENKDTTVILDLKPNHLSRFSLTGINKDSPFPVLAGLPVYQTTTAAVLHRKAGRTVFTILDK